ncbi:MAG: glucose-6-phosphate dehydrogenase [Devosia sp.]
MSATSKSNDAGSDGPKPAPACTLVIFGAGGDLTKRLLMPALYNLVRSGLINDQTRILGVDWVQMTAKVWAANLTDTMRTFALGGPAEFHVDAIDSEAWGFITERLDYLQGDFLADQTYSALSEAIEGSAIFYFAVAERFFAPIAAHLGSAGLLDQHDGNFRHVVIEKPFGRDLASARQLNADLLAVADESQLFRIDHFLGKETVQSIMALRFTNGIFEPIWRREHVDHVQITVAETIGVEARGGFYDVTGALRDMVPNHLFQLLCMAAMEPPNSFSPDAVRNARQQLLEAISPIAVEDAVRGQYTAGNGLRSYRDADHVDPKSAVETYAALKLDIGNWRWQGVPFYLRTGKSMGNRLSEIAVVFKVPPRLMFSDQPAQDLTPNVIRFQISPEHGTRISFNSKVPGPELRIGVVASTFRDSDFFPERANVGYETLIYDCMNGDTTLFQRADNIEAGWAAVGDILQAWTKGKPEAYKSGSDGPSAADELLARDGRAWLPLDETPTPSRRQKS